MLIAYFLLALSTLTSAATVPPQKVRLEFGSDVPFTVEPTGIFGYTFGYEVNRQITTPAASYTAAQKQQIQAQLDDVLEVSGISNIQFVVSPVFGGEDVTYVYFGNDPSGPLAGYTLGGPDQFNERRFNEIVVYNVEPLTDAETAAHELGHALGLRHVEPGIYTDPMTQLRYVEVMRKTTDRPPDTHLRFIDRKSSVIDPTAIFTTHNPIYHLERYVEGTAHADLIAAGTLPGSWDQTLLDYYVSFLFDDDLDQPSTLHQVRILVGGDAETATVLAMFDQIKLGDRGCPGSGAARLPFGRHAQRQTGWCRAGDILNFFKKVGSNFTIQNGKITWEPVGAWKTIVAQGPFRNQRVFSSAGSSPDGDHKTRESIRCWLHGAVRSLFRDAACP